MKIKCINHACFKVELSGKILFFDPYQIPDNAEKADIILASHDHSDHFEEKSANKVKKDNTVTICPASCKNIEGRNIKAGDSIEIEGINIKAVESYTLTRNNHPKRNNWLGYIVSDGKVNIYHAGDTGKIPEMTNFTDIDYCLIPCGGRYTMDPEEALEAVKMIKPKNVIPMHSWTDGTLNKFVNLLKTELPDIGVIKLGPGESFTP